MILADELLAWTRERHRRSRVADQRNLLDLAIVQAHRFVLSPEVQILANGLQQRPDALQTARETRFLPSGSTWIEWAPANRPHIRNGLLLIGDGERSVSEGMIFMVSSEERTLSAPLIARFDLAADAPIRAVAAGEQIYQMFGGEPVPRHQYSDWSLALVAILAVINSPRIVRFADEPNIRRLNQKRLREHKTPFLTWRTIKINVDGRQEHIGHQKNETGKMPLHFTRSHLRRVKGEWRLIQAYWSGDAKNGRILKSYQVARAGELARRGDHDIKQVKH